MNKKLFFVFIFSCSTLAFAQVGIRTDSPNSTLEISKIEIGNSEAKDGVIIPKLTKAELSEKLLNTYTILQDGALVYITNNLATDSTTPSFNKVSEINNIGFHYYHALSEKWLPLSSNLYISDGILTSDRIVNQNNKKLNFIYNSTSSSGSISNVSSHVKNNPNNNIMTIGGRTTADINPLLALNQDSKKVGVRINSPRTTFHIKEDVDINNSTGLLIPRLTKEQLYRKTISNDAPQSLPYQLNSGNIDQSDLGTLVYVYNTSATMPQICGTLEGETACVTYPMDEVTKDGFYYYNGTWKRLLVGTDSPWMSHKTDDNIVGIVLKRSGLDNFTAETVDSNIMVKNNGNLGLKNFNPRTSLDVNGVIAIKEFSKIMAVGSPTLQSINPQSSLYTFKNNSVSPYTSGDFYVKINPQIYTVATEAVPAGYATGIHNGSRLTLVNKTTVNIRVHEYQSISANPPTTPLLVTILPNTAKEFILAGDTWTPLN